MPRRLRIGHATRILTASAGSLVLAGSGAALRRGLSPPAAAGSYAVSGRPAGLRHGHVLRAQQGTYSIAGQDALFGAGAARWSSTATWGGSVPTTGENVTIPVGQTVLLDVNTANLGLLVVAGTLRVDSTTSNLILRAKGVVILTTGRMLIGTLAQRYSGFVIELDGQPVTGSIAGPSHLAGDVPAGNPNDAYFGYEGASRGIINMGEFRWLPTKRTVVRTKLNAHSSAGVTSHTVADALDWPIGSNVLIGPTDYWDNSLPEVHTLAATAGGTTIQTTAGLASARWGLMQYMTDTGMSLTPGTYALKKAHADQPTTLDERAKVALLDRNGEIRCPDDTAWQTERFGAHFMAMGATAITEIEGVRWRRHGQGGRLGRYGFHTHMQSWNQTTGEFLGAVHPDNRVEDCVFWQGTNRGPVLHGSVGFKLINNVSHDTRGHNLFLEDGSEYDNIIVGNWLSGTEDPHTGVTQVPITCTLGTPATFNRTAHGWTNGHALRISAGTYPSPLTPGGTSTPTVFWIVNATANTFQLADTPNGAPLATTTAGSGLQAHLWWRIKFHDSSASGVWVSNANNEIRLNAAFGSRGRGWWQAYTYAKKFRQAIAGSSMFTTGTPGKVKWTAHGLAAGQTLIYSHSSGGAPAAGLTNGMTVWVRNPTADDFEVSATPSGSSIAITSVGSGNHTFMTGGCFGASANVPIQPFYTPPKLDGNGNPLFTQNESHSNRLEQNLLEFAPINERGQVTQPGGFPPGALDGNGPFFKTPAHRDGTPVNGVFDRFFLWKGPRGGYENRTVNPHYKNWLTSDNIGVHFFGATQEGFNNKIQPGTLICESLNVTARPAGVSNVDNGVASYHSGLFFQDITHFGFSPIDPKPANAAHVTSAHLQLLGRSFMQTWDLYTDPVEMQTGNHSNWRGVNSDPMYRTPPPHIMNDAYDQWSGNQPMDIPGAGPGGTTYVRHWTLASAIWDLTGAMCGTPRRYIIFDHPYLTYGLSSSVLESPPEKMTRLTPDPIYGIQTIGDDSGNFEFLCVPGAKTFTRLDSALNPVPGAVWDLANNTESSFLGSMHHGACPRAGYTRLRTPSRGPQSTLQRYRISNVSRKAGVDGQTADDFFYFDVEWSGTTVPRVFASVGIIGTWPNYDLDPSDPGTGKGVEYLSQSSLANLQAATVSSFWRDAPNNRVVIKVMSHHHSWTGWANSPVDTNARAFSLVVRPA